VPYLRRLGPGVSLRRPPIQFRVFACEIRGTRRGNWAEYSRNFFALLSIPSLLLPRLPSPPDECQRRIIVSFVYVWRLWPGTHSAGSRVRTFLADWRQLSDCNYKSEKQEAAVHTPPPPALDPKEEARGNDIRVGFPRTSVYSVLRRGRLYVYAVKLHFLNAKPTITGTVYEANTKIIPIYCCTSLPWKADTYLHTRIIVIKGKSVKMSLFLTN
jgi:hypothetical protein